jgi:hypothetical protein
VTKNRCSTNTLVLSLAIGALLICAATAQAATAYAPVLDGCLSTTFGKVPECTSNDINLTAVEPGTCSFTANSCTGNCDSTTDPADYTIANCGTVTMTGCVGQFNITSVERYDVGLYISTDGDPNGDFAKSGLCSRNAWNTSDPLTSGFHDTDDCGDVNAQGQTIGLPIPDTTILCVDANDDGKVDISHCETWANSADQLDCNSSQDVEPGTTSHCNCGILAGACIPFPSEDECKENVCELRCGGVSTGDPCTSNDDCGAGVFCLDTLVTNNVADDTSCGDGGNICDGLQTCQAGECVTGGPLDCDDNSECTTDTCDPAVEGGCVNTNITCNDGDACTTDSCDPASGCTTTPVVCNDGDACTTDGCDPTSGCTTTPVVCNDGDACTTDSCDPASGCTTTPVVCNDGSACTTDSCDPASGCTTTPVVCNDNNACTIDSCDPATGCVYTATTCNEGCTPGFWKSPQHVGLWCAAYTPTTLVSSVFDTTDCGCNFSSLTFRQALSGKGGSTICAAQLKLYQAAVAALLNACSVNYSLSTAQIINEVNAALASCDKSTILAEASRLDTFNNLGAELCGF